MQYKPNQRVAYYEVTGKSETCGAKVAVGEILIDRPRGEVTSWDILNTATGTVEWIAGKRIGFARVDQVSLLPVPEPALQAELDRRRYQTLTKTISDRAMANVAGTKHLSQDTNPALEREDHHG
jgi:hypothetical protein